MIESIVEGELANKDEYIRGYADVADMINADFTSYRYAIVIGKKMDSQIIDGIKNGPTQDYLNNSSQIYEELKIVAASIVDKISQAGFNALILDPTFSEDATAIMSKAAGLPHKHIAARAGLGWIGKTDLFISKSFGPRLRLITILTNGMPLKLGTPVTASLCGSCNLCVDKCPAGAANGRLWSLQSQQSDYYDYIKCWKKCDELGKVYLNVAIPICGICTSVCPIGKKRM